MNQFTPGSMRVERRRVLFCFLASLALMFVSAFIVDLNRVKASVDDPFTDLGVIKSGPDSAAPGSNVTYTITVTNSGPDDAVNATLNDPLPVGTTFVSLSSPAPWSCTNPSVGSNGTVNCTRPSFPVAGSDAFTLIVKVESEATPGEFISNKATVSSDTPDSNEENDSSTASTLVTGGTSADVRVTKTSNSDSAVADTDVTYTITVANNGPNTAADVSMTDTLGNGSPPNPMSFVSFTAPGGWNCGNPSTTTTCTIASLPINSPQVFTLVAHIPSETQAGTQYTNIATVSSSSDPNSENDAASVTTIVADRPDLMVTKTHLGTFSQGDTDRTYTITVSNLALNPSVGLVTLTESLPAGLIARSLSGMGWTCDSISAGGAAGPATLKCTRSDSIANSSYPPITLMADVSCAAAASVTNTATVSGGGDATPGNNTANDPTTINPDTTQPIISCPGSITRVADPGQNGANVNPGTPAASDNCGTVTVTGVRSDGKPLSAPYPVGVTIITWTAKDAANNTASCGQSIIVTAPSSFRRRLP